MKYWFDEDDDELLDEMVAMWLATASLGDGLRQCAWLQLGLGMVSGIYGRLQVGLGMVSGKYGWLQLGLGMVSGKYGWLQLGLGMVSGNVVGYSWAWGWFQAMWLVTAGLGDGFRQCGWLQLGLGMVSGIYGRLQLGLGMVSGNVVGYS